MIYIISLGGVLFGLWLLLSGHYTVLLVTLGLVSTLIVVLIAWRMDVADEEALPMHFSLGMLSYIPWLVKEIFTSNVAVARIILDPRLPISPTMDRFHGTQKTDLGRFFYGNSITLTPGTVTTRIEGEEFEVHALTRAMFDGTQEGEMDRRVSRLED